MSDILNCEDTLAGANACAGRDRKLKMRANSCLGFDKPTVGLHHGNIILRQPKGRIEPHQVVRGEDLVRQPVLAGCRKRALHQHPVGPADFRDAGDGQKLAAAGTLKLPPQRIGSLHQGT